MHPRAAHDYVAKSRQSCYRNTSACAYSDFEVHDVLFRFMLQMCLLLLLLLRGSCESARSSDRNLRVEMLMLTALIMLCCAVQLHIAGTAASVAVASRQMHLSTIHRRGLQSNLCTLEGIQINLSCLCTMLMSADVDSTQCAVFVHTDAQIPFLTVFCKMTRIFFGMHLRATEYFRTVCRKCYRGFFISCADADGARTEISVQKPSAAKTAHVCCCSTVVNHCGTQKLHSNVVTNVKRAAQTFTGHICRLPLKVIMCRYA